MPKFAPGYDNQKGKADDISRALENRLKKHLPFGFKALAGDGKVDVVKLAEHGGVKAYVFIIPMGRELAAISPDGKHFYYKIPTFCARWKAKPPRPSLLVIWPKRGDNFFMFVLQHKNSGCRASARVALRRGRPGIMHLDEFPALRRSEINLAFAARRMPDVSVRRRVAVGSQSNSTTAASPCRRMDGAVVSWSARRENVSRMVLP